ncbi:MAG: septum formation initiator family protein [Bacilli bacterium]|nr:septum formation initiator family protein [Bacilli bacterium]
MKKKSLKRAKQRLILLIVLFIGGCIFVSANIFKTWLQIIDNKHTVVMLNNEYNNLLDEEKQLKSDVNKLQDPDYVARYAREKYLYSKDGELIFRYNEDVK